MGKNDYSCGRLDHGGNWVAALLVLLAVPVCALAQVPSVVDETQAKSGSTAVEQKTAIRFSRFRTVLRTGDPIGEIKTGTECGATTRLSMNARTEQAVMAPMVRVVREELTRAGYSDPASTQPKLFEDDRDRKMPDLLLGGMLEEFQTSYCSTGSGARTEGKVQVKVRWELYDPVQRKVIHGMTAQGNYETSGAETIREGEFFSMAYRVAVKQLLGDQKFIDSVAMSSTAGDVVPATTAGSSAGPLVLKRIVPPRDALNSNMTLIRAAVVTVSHAGGSGSGFFVSENGHVMTNSHVVGSNRFVRVTLATGRELVGEVIKRDPDRDIALIKTEGSKFAALALGGGEVNVGSEVIAIGSPLGEALSGTVTRGIVSAYRTIKGQRYIQSDAPVLPGSSGGPLLDKSGYVVAVTASGIGTARIGFFVPIQEALSSMAIKLTSP